MKIRTLIPAFTLGLCLFSGVAHAELITQGGFGADGVNGQSIPTKKSIQHAASLYEALSVKADKLGNKEIVVKDGSALSCTKPTKGMSGALYAGCELLLRQNTKPVLRNVDNKTLKADLSFRGEIAEKILASMDVKASSLFSGYEKTVANVHCERSGTTAVCEIKDTVVSQWEIDAADIADFTARD